MAHISSASEQHDPISSGNYSLGVLARPAIAAWLITHALYTPYHIGQLMAEKVYIDALSCHLSRAAVPTRRVASSCHMLYLMLS